MRASFSHPVIDEAIGLVVEAGISAGPSPEVGNCADFADRIGHLTPSASIAVGQAIAASYAKGDLSGGPPPQRPAPTEIAAAALDVVPYNDAGDPDQEMTVRIPEGAGPFPATTRTLQGWPRAKALQPSQSDISSPRKVSGDGPPRFRT